MNPDRDDGYLAALLAPIGACRHYRPWFGEEHRHPVELGDFLAMFGGDTFYHAVGFDSPAMYTAHRVAGGMTSLYRQLGIGARRLVRAVLADAFGLTEEAATWRSNRQDLGCLVLAGDGCDAARNLRAWLDALDRQTLRGVAIEVRQGIKTGDARRQYSYVEANGFDAYERDALPVLMLLSAQAKSQVVAGYRDADWRVLVGDPALSPYASTYGFVDYVTGFDLAGFLRRHRARIEREIGGTMRELLAA